jgi:hypothetical protein
MILGGRSTNSAREASNRRDGLVRRHSHPCRTRIGPASGRMHRPPRSLDRCRSRPGPVRFESSAISWRCARKSSISPALAPMPIRANSSAGWTPCARKACEHISSMPSPGAPPPSQPFSTSAASPQPPRSAERRWRSETFPSVKGFHGMKPCRQSRSTTGVHFAVRSVLDPFSAPGSDLRSELNCANFEPRSSFYV